MTWASIVSTGRGKVVGFRLCVEGWPEVWVSNKLITCTSGLDGRTVRVGLLSTGLGFSERLSMHEARTLVRGFTASVASVDRDDNATASFSQYVRPVAYLSASISDTATSLTASSSLTSGTYYHLGTETILATSTGSSPRIVSVPK